NSPKPEFPPAPGWSESVVFGRIYISTIIIGNANMLYTADIRARFCSSSNALRSTRYARYISVAIAEPFNLGSLGQGSPHVKFPQIIPLIKPKKQKITPTLTLSTATRSSCCLVEDKYLTL